MLRFECPICSKRMKTYFENADGIVTCPRCRTKVQAPPDEFAQAPKVRVPIPPAPVFATAPSPHSAWLRFIASLNFWLRTLWSVLWIGAFFCVPDRNLSDLAVCFVAWTLIWPLTFVIAVIGALVESAIEYFTKLDARHEPKTI